MYIPKDFLQTDEKEIFFYLNKYPFGILISNIDNIPYATHLPFTWEKVADSMVIKSHLAKANQHSQHLNSAEALFIVRGPRCYISTKNYPSSQNVPTWGKLQNGLVYEWVVRNTKKQVRRLFYVETFWMLNLDLFHKLK